MTISNEQQEQMFHKYYVKPDHKMDFIEIREIDRLIDLCEIFGLDEPSQKTMTGYLKDQINRLILDNENKQILIFDSEGAVVNAFFSSN
jgi:hypothetical protein